MLVWCGMHNPHAMLNCPQYILPPAAHACHCQHVSAPTHCTLNALTMPYYFVTNYTTLPMRRPTPAVYVRTRTRCCTNNLLPFGQAPGLLAKVRSGHTARLACRPQSLPHTRKLSMHVRLGVRAKYPAALATKSRPLKQPVHDSCSRGSAGSHHSSAVQPGRLAAAAAVASTMPNKHPIPPPAHVPDSTHLASLPQTSKRPQSLAPNAVCLSQAPYM